MSFGFGRNSGPKAQPSERNPFNHSLHRPSLQPSNSVFPDSSAASRFPSPRASLQTSTSPFPNSSAALRFPSPRTSLQTSSSSFLDPPASLKFPRPSGASPQISTSPFPASSGSPQFPSPRISTQPSTSPFPDYSAPRWFSSPRPSVQPAISDTLYYSADPQFPRPRTFEVLARPPSSVDTARLASGSFPPTAAPSRASPLRWGDIQNSIREGIDDPSQKRFMPRTAHNLGSRVSSKSSPSQGLEVSRRAPVQYTDDFLRDPDSDVMEGNTDSASNRYGHVALQKKQSPMAVANNNPVISPTDSLNKSLKPSFSPPKSRSGLDVARDSQFSQRISPSADGFNGNTHQSRLPSHSLTKRTRSPPAVTGRVQLNSLSTENDSEREEQAKAKRLARFKTELDEVEPTVTVHSSSVTQKKTSSPTQFGHSAVESKHIAGYRPPGSSDDMSHEYDNGDLQSSSIIVGLCPDMCPESERGERERKGDLDRYERLDGDRNQTSKVLAVKKYNRTAEREAGLIRPMPILQKTMDYLLGLLDQPYDERFLGLYNFLWDRMRAIRMDLRMQHIFNLKAITMLEKMIRLHIIAMHELCKFSKGEGFSEGFDAHLNIEQMNKTSVELFQLYDDHRKKGIYISTEKEFRGYYALLKLDKHPGYKVEPAELSLDLSQMTSEIRQTQEVAFARDVGRSCRTSNFIAFFRHARKASYLQACLMHAHFSKLRTQALASLHSGLQYSQGLPVTHVAKWLGMEGEDIETLLEYHGFLIKEFEEPFMVKDGPFLNDDKDYPTRGSILVHEKKSSTILEDVLSSHLVMFPSESESLQPSQDNKNKPVVLQVVRASNPHHVSVAGDMEVEAVPSPRSSSQSQLVPEQSRSMQVQPLPDSRIGQPFNDHPGVSASSPRSDTKIAKAFVFGIPGMLEQLSPMAQKSGSIVLDDGQSSHKSSQGKSADRFVLAPQTSSLNFTIQDDFEGFIPSSPGPMVHSECNAMTPPLAPVDIGELTPSGLVFGSVVATPREESDVVQYFTAEATSKQERSENDDNTSTFDKEIAEAKLRLLLRLWRRRFLRKKKLLQDNKFAANAALSSLSLGLSLWQSKDKPATPQKVDIDKALHERNEKWQQSWSRWNVSELVASTLAEKNANSSCVCWKVVAFSWLQHGSYDIEARSSMTHMSLDEWLRFKLFSQKNDSSVGGLAMSAPGLSVWSKWDHNGFGDTTCYFSIIRDTPSSSLEMKLVGASAVVFPISETVPLDLQKIQLHNIAMSLPSEARIPLLIVFGSGEDNVADLSSSIVGKLGLEDLDKSYAGKFLVVCLNERDDSGQYYGYFCDQKLKEGLIWLASESQAPPVLSCVTTRELVSLHLGSCLDAVNLLVSDRVAPNQCILAFNEALDQAVNDIVDAANANPSGWPCPEPFLVDEYSAEFRAVKQFLPNLGWSSSEEVDPFVSALRSCKLPSFSDDVSWLSKGCSSEGDIEEQRQRLQDCLFKYLTQTSNMMYLTMAVKEANLMVQNCTMLELHDTEYKMTPNWVLIFRRVFNWQLNNAACFTRKAYVLQQTHSSCNLRYLEKLKLEVPVHRPIIHPSLDEMVEVSYSPISSKRLRSSPKCQSNLASVSFCEDMAGASTFTHSRSQNNHYPEFRIQSVDDSDKHLAESDLELGRKDGNKADKLVELLEQCNILQDENQKKLSFYF